MQGLKVRSERSAESKLDLRENGMEFLHKSGDTPLPGYTIKRGVGSGGFGEVYFAISDGGKEVALKLVRRHLDVEIRGVKQCINLKSPNLVAIYDVREDDAGSTWIIMEYVNGPSLHQRMSVDRAPHRREESLRWMRGIAQGVDYLHRNGIVHRDLKPGNIFLDDDVVKIGDYGLSKFIGVSRRSNQTQSIGTVHYMAPEISTGNYGRSVDIYSTAVISYELLTGNVPFDGETPGEILMKHLTALPDLSNVDATCRKVFERALAKSPEDRYASASELVDAIEVALGVVPTASPRLVSEPLKQETETPIQETPKRGDPFAETTGLPKIEGPISLPPLPGTFAATRREWSNVLWRVFLAGLLSPMLSMIVITAAIAFGSVREIRAYDFTMLTTLTGVASAGLLMIQRGWHRRSDDSSLRHLVMLTFGLVFGLLWFAADAFLGLFPFDPYVDWSLHTFGSEAMLRQMAPLAFGYLGSCGLAFAIPDWGSSMSPERVKRISLGSIAWPALVGFFAATLLGHFDNSINASGFAAVMGMTGLIVQWVTPHESPMTRRRRVRRQFTGR